MYRRNRDKRPVGRHDAAVEMKEKAAATHNIGSTS